MKIEYLYAIVELYKYRYLKRAAEELDISDRTLKKYIECAEKDIGIKIVEGYDSGIKFTDKGEKLYLYAEKIISNLESYKRNIEHRKIQYNLAAEVRIFLSYVLLCSKTVIDEFNIKFNFFQIYREEIISGLVNGKFDLGIMTMDDITKKSLDMSGIKFVPLSKRKAVVLVSDEHPLANKKEISLNDLDKFRRIAFENPFDDYYNYCYKIEYKDNLNRADIFGKNMSDVLLVLKESDYYFIGGIIDTEKQLLTGLKAIPIKEIKNEVEVGYAFNKSTDIDIVLNRLINLVDEGIKYI